MRWADVTIWIMIQTCGMCAPLRCGEVELWKLHTFPQLFFKCATGEHSFQIIGFVCNPTEIAILRKRREESTLAHLFYGCLFFIARLGRKCAERPTNKNDEGEVISKLQQISLISFSRAFKLINQCVYAINSHRGVRGWRESVGTMTEAIHCERGERGEGGREGRRGPM